MTSVLEILKSREEDLINGRYFNGSHRDFDIEIKELEEQIEFFKKEKARRAVLLAEVKEAIAVLEAHAGVTK